MPQSENGSCSRRFFAQEEIRAPYYGARFVAAHPQVPRIHAHLLPGGGAAVYGVLEVLLLFTYTGQKGEAVAFTSTVRRDFCEVVPLPDDARPDEDARPDVQFNPEVVCRPARRSSYIWSVEIAGELALVFGGWKGGQSRQTPEVPSVKRLTPDSAAEDAPSEETFARPESALPQDPPDAAASPIRNVIPDDAVDGEVKCWRLGRSRDIPFEQLFDLEATELDRLEEDSDTTD